MSESESSPEREGQDGSDSHKISQGVADTPIFKNVVAKSVFETPEKSSPLPSSKARNERQQKAGGIPLRTPLGLPPAFPENKAKVRSSEPAESAVRETPLQSKAPLTLPHADSSWQTVVKSTAMSTPPKPISRRLTLAKTVSHQLNNSTQNRSSIYETLGWDDDDDELA
jgi:hypothetical protein